MCRLNLFFLNFLKPFLTHLCYSLALLTYATSQTGDKFCTVCRGSPDSEAGTEVHQLIRGSEEEASCTNSKANDV